jgi:trimethylamine--corrinoid protein Co-methyltransferase
VDNLWGPADLDGATMMDLPYVLLATEAQRQTGRLAQGMCADEEHLLFEVIAAMRYQGEYLGDPSTKRFFRSEHLLPKLFQRESFEAWQARGQTEEEMAMGRVKEILRTHEPEPLPDEVNRELDRIMVRAAEELAG